MDDLFTEHVRNLGVRDDDAETDAVLAELRSLLVFQLQKKNVWQPPGPRYLGYSASLWDEGTIQEVVHDCYVFVFVDRINGLKGQLERKRGLSTIPGCIAQSVKNFVFSRQKQTNPIKYSLFFNLRAVLEQLVSSRLLSAGECDDRPEQTTIFRSVGTSDGPASSRVVVLSLLKDDSEFLGNIEKLQVKSESNPAQRVLKKAIENLIDSGVSVFQMETVYDCLFQTVEEHGLVSSHEPLDFLLDYPDHTKDRGYLKEEEELSSSEVHSKIDALPRREYVKRQLKMVVDSMLENHRNGIPITQLHMSHKLEIPTSTMSEYFAALRSMTEETGEN